VFAVASKCEEIVWGETKPSFQNLKFGRVIFDTFSANTIYTSNFMSLSTGKHRGVTIGAPILCSSRLGPIIGLQAG
jgi:hypothetical protein